MPPTGRPRTPTSQLKIRGTFRSDRRDVDGEPTAPVAIPKKPVFLKKEAAKEWKRITPILAQMKCISQADMALVAAYCFEWGLYVTLCKEIKTVGDMIETTINGHKISNPLVNIRNRAFKNMKEIATEFGLSPSARTRIKTEPGQPADNPFAQFLNAG